jgi:hypothetical protein
LQFQAPLIQQTRNDKNYKKELQIATNIKGSGQSAEKITYFSTQSHKPIHNMLVPLFYQLPKTSCVKQHRLLSLAQLYLTQNICTEGTMFATNMFFQGG